MSKELINLCKIIFTMNCNVNKVQPTYMYVDERKCFEKRKFLRKTSSRVAIFFKEEFKNSGNT